MDSSMSFRDRSASSNLLRASWAAGGVGTEVRGAPTPSMKRGQRVVQTSLILPAPGLALGEDGA